MRRWLHVQRYVQGESRALETLLLRRTETLLRAATQSEDGGPAADGSYVITLTTRLAGLEVIKHVRVRTGVAYRSGLRTLLPITWHAEPARHAFPAFEGTLELEPLDEHTAALSLAGSYRTPLGPLGGVADAAALHHVAVATAERLVAGLADELERVAAEPGRPTRSRGPRRGEPLRVGDVMTPDPIVFDASMPLRTASLLLFHAEISGAPVVTASGELIGVLSERDLLAKEATTRFGIGRAVADEDRRREARTAGEACSRPARTTVPDARLADVARMLLDYDISRLVVVDGGEVAGIVSRHDVLAALLRDDAEILYVLQQELKAHDAEDVEVTVHAGVVELAGRARLRSVAEQLPALAATIDGVIAVDADDLMWAEDDILPPVPYI